MNIYEQSTVLRGVVGSTAHGLSLAGSDDLDEMAICIEPIQDVICLGQQFENFIYRSAADRTGKHDARSEAGDLDLTIFSLRKFCRLAASGNPTVLLMFYTPQLSICTEVGQQLRDMAPKFISKEAGKRFLGYMHGQRLRLLGEKGQKRVKRPELEEMYGFDTKYAMHVLRLGLQGLELLETGSLTLPMAAGYREYLMKIRTGHYPLEHIIDTAHEYEADLEKLLTSSNLPDHPDRPSIEKWMQLTYLTHWNKGA